MARSLFLGETSRDVQRFGPWLISIKSPAETGKVLNLVGENPAVVFWSCRSGSAALYDHLRRLNLVKVRKAVSPDKAGATAETVLFRYWDPRVLSVVMPLLDEAQFARVLGPCDEAVAIDPEKLGGFGLRRIQRFPELPVSPRDMLSINAEQIAAMDTSMQQRSRRKIRTYLLDVAPEMASRLSQADLNDRVLRAEETGKALGIAGERAHLKWAYIMLITNGKAATSPQVTSAITSGGRPPDEAVEIVMRQVVRASRSSGDS